MSSRPQRKRPLIAFFDYLDVFEDFYPHYGVDQRSFITKEMASGNYAFLSIIQREVGDVLWYVFSLKPELTEAHHEVVGCQVKFLPSSWLHRCLWRAFYLPRCAWRWRGAYRAYATVASYLALFSLPFFKTLRRDRPDMFLVQDYASGRFDVLILLAKWLGVPLIARHTGGIPDRYLGRTIRRWTLPRADRLIVSGHDESEMLATRYHVERERLSIILTPIDTTVFCPMDRDESCRNVGLDSTRRYLLFVGRLEDQVKRVSAIIRAFAQLATKHSDIDLVIAGDGPDAEKLHRLAEEQAAGRIRFLGWVSDVETKARLFNASECLVLASWREGFPSVVGEAMACGTPVVSSHVGGVSELVMEGQTGWMFPAGDDEALSNHLAFVASHPEVARSMRAEVRRTAERRVSKPEIVAALRKCFSRNGKSHE